MGFLVGHVFFVIACYERIRLLMINLAVCFMTFDKSIFRINVDLFMLYVTLRSSARSSFHENTSKATSKWSLLVHVRYSFSCVENQNNLLFQGDNHSQISKTIQYDFWGFNIQSIAAATLKVLKYYSIFILVIFPITC